MKTTALLFTLLSLSAVASAADVGQHPAVFAPRSLPGIDASTFIPGHPAGGATGRAPNVTLASQAESKPAAKAPEAETQVSTEQASTKQASTKQADAVVATAQR